MDRVYYIQMLVESGYWQRESIHKWFTGGGFLERICSRYRA